MDFVLISPSNCAQRIRKILEKAELWDESRRLQTLKDRKVAIPILSKDIDTTLFTDILPDNEIITDRMVLPISKKSAIKTPACVLKENMKDFVTRFGIEWTVAMDTDLPVSWEKHGDMILLSDSCFTLPVWKELGDEVWNVVITSLQCKRLAVKSTICDNGFRSPQVKLLVGEDAWVNQTDNKIRFTYNISKCMFSIGNITEKLRIAKFKCTGETIVDLYAGIGYFTLPYLVHAQADYVHACEWNPGAVEALKKNLELNDVQDRCTVYYGDNRKVCPVGIADRVNVGLIPSSQDGWPVACAALKPSTGGYLHIHGNVTTNNSVNNHAQTLTAQSNCDFKTENINIKTENSGIKTENSDIKTENSGIKTKNSDIKTENSGIKTENSSVKTENSSVKTENSSVKTDKSSVKTENISVKTENNFIKCDKQEYCDHSINNKSGRSDWKNWADLVSIKIRQLLQDYHHRNWITTIHHIEHVKSYAPHVDHLVLDLECRPVAS